MKLNKKKILKNYIFIVLDSSTSMEKIKDATIDAYNALTEVYKYPPKGQENIVSFLTFGTFVNSPLFVHSTPANIIKLKDSNYKPDGWTALFDAVASAADVFDYVDDADENSFLILAITDGDNNRSVRYNDSNFKNFIRKYNRENWTITFSVPRGKKEKLVSIFGIPEDNIQEWEQTDQGTREAFADTQDAMSNYYDARSRGERKSKTFFKKVQSNVPKNARTLLKDLSDSFKCYKVISEEVIRPFVEDKTGATYKKGSAYYLLMKEEKVQPNKEVLIQEKGKKAIYGGPEAREMIGLPNDEYAKVDPGNHGNYDVFIQSRSVNRILPRGTKVLVKI